MLSIFLKSDAHSLCLPSLGKGSLPRQHSILHSLGLERQAELESSLSLEEGFESQAIGSVQSKRFGIRAGLLKDVFWPLSSPVEGK